MNSHEIERILLEQIYNICKDNPKFLARVIDAGTYGVSDAARLAQERAADMETFACAMASMVKESHVSKKLKDKMNDLAISKLEKHIGKTSLNWNWAVKEE